MMKKILVVLLAALALAGCAAGNQTETTGAPTQSQQVTQPAETQQETKETQTAEKNRVYHSLPGD